MFPVRKVEDNPEVQNKRETKMMLQPGAYPELTRVSVQERKENTGNTGRGNTVSRLQR